MSPIDDTAVAFREVIACIGIHLDLKTRSRDSIPVGDARSNSWPVRVSETFHGTFVVLSGADAGKRVATAAEFLADVHECLALRARFLPRFCVRVISHRLLGRLRKWLHLLNAFGVRLIHRTLGMDARCGIADFSTYGTVFSIPRRVERLGLPIHSHH